METLVVTRRCSFFTVTSRRGEVLLELPFVEAVEMKVEPQ
jgi:hypothetical protein